MGTARDAPPIVVTTITAGPNDVCRTLRSPSASSSVIRNAVAIYARKWSSADAHGGVTPRPACHSNATAGEWIAWIVAAPGPASALDSDAFETADHNALVTQTPTTPPVSLATTK